jgi:hypothetical protein
MAWWEIIMRRLNIGDQLFTPGKGDQGFRKKPFTVLEIESAKIIVASGHSKITLERECFEATEKAFSENPALWLRVAALHDMEPAKGSVDELVRDATGSQLARGNYICSILEHCGEVRYTMRGNKKGIELRKKLISRRDN